MDADRQLYEFEVAAPRLLTTCNVSLSLSTRCEPEHYDSFADVATFHIRTGACDMQTYMTAPALRHIAAAMLAAAERVEARVPPLPEAA